MIALKTISYFRLFIVCAFVSSAFILQAGAEEKTPKIPDYVMALFDDKTDAPVERAYLSAAEVYALLNENPVFCTANTETVEMCVQV